MNTVNGLLLIDKPEGCSSHDMVARARRVLGMKAIGHGGTLDPMASGLLVLLAGEGTKLSDYILQGDKGYQARVRLGIETDTLDRTGKVTQQKDVKVTRADIERVIEEMTGELELLIPQYSAVKVNGKKMYETVRRGREVPEIRRSMRFYEVHLVDSGDDWFSVEMKCSKGSFIRSWAQEAGRRLGTGATLDALRRTWSSPYNVAQATKLEDVKSGVEQTPVQVIPLSETLPDWPALMVDGKDRVLIENGQISYKLRARLRPYQDQFKPQGKGLKVVGQHDKNLLALLVFDEKIQDFSIERVFRS